MGTVSVIIPVFNAITHLEACLDSVLSQTYTDIEVIIVNDGSTDGTTELLKKYISSDRRVKLIDQTNQGVSASRNNAISRAGGEYITFVDADDRLTPDALERMVELIKTHQVDIVRTSYVGSDSDRADVVLRGFIKTYRGGDVATIVGAIVTGKLPGYVWLLMYRNREKLRSIRFDESLSMMEDTLFYIDLISATDSIFVSDTHTYYYTFNKDSASRSTNRTLINIADVMKLNEKITSRFHDDAELLGQLATTHVNIIANMLFELFYFKPRALKRIFESVDGLSKPSSFFVRMAHRSDISALRPHLQYTINTIVKGHKVRLLLIFTVRSVYRKITGRNTL